MSDDVENQQDETAPEEPTGPLGGERLAEARREQQISVARDCERVASRRTESART